jgi:hypothetical protein
MAGKATDQTVPVYLRMPRSASESLNEIAAALDLKPSAVANAIFRFIMYPDWFVDWKAHVDMLRKVVSRGIVDGPCQANFSVDEWLTHGPLYKKLDEMGLIENFDFSSSLSETRDIICSFSVSDAGRVIAEIFKETGITNAIGPDEFEKPSGGTSPAIAS